MKRVNVGHVRPTVRFIAMASALALTVGACGSSQDDGQTDSKSYEFKFANYTSAAAVNSQATELWAKELEKRSDGRIKIKFVYSEGLLKAADSLQGIGEGRADMGYIAPQYTPTQLPLSQLAGIPFLTSNAAASATAQYQLYQADSDFKQEYTKQKVRVLTTTPMPNGIIVSKKPVNSLDDFKGAQIRTTGFLSDVFNTVGANSIALAQPEIYEGLQRGVLQMGSGGTLDIATDIKLEEVAKHFIEPGTGNFGIAFNVMNLKKWESLPEDLQKIITDVSDEQIARYVPVLTEKEKTACEAAKKAGVTLSRLPESEIEAWKTKIGDSIKKKWFSSVASIVDDPQGFLNGYVDLYEKALTAVDYTPGMDACLA